MLCVTLLLADQSSIRYRRRLQRPQLHQLRHAYGALWHRHLSLNQRLHRLGRLIMHL
ncbi:Uncharacterised protein [Vibrio cholerae]|nr:Uncharacterised protein [Vibrio cholerae]